MALKAWYTFNNNYNNQGCGDAELTVVTAPTYVDGKMGKALNQGAFKWTAEQTAQILNNKAITICFWVYVDLDTGSTSNRAMFFGNDSMNSAGGRQFSLFNFSTSNDLHWSWQHCINGTYSMVTSGIVSNVIPSRTWTHIAVTYENPNGTIYINGVQKQTFTGAYKADSFAFETQVIHNSQYHRFNDYRIYDECLSQKQIKEISKGLVAHYKLEGTGANPNLIRMGGLINSGATSVNYDNSTDTYTIVSPVGTSTWGYGVNIGSTNKVVIPYNQKYRMSCEVWVPTEHKLVVDYNNYSNDSAVANWNGNDNDLGNQRLANSVIIPANTWTKVVMGSMNAHASNTSQTAIYEVSRYGLYTNNDTEPTTWYLRHFKVELGDKVTDWIPNTADAAYTALGYNNMIARDVSGNGYNGMVSGTLSYNVDSPRYSGSTTFNGSSYITSEPGSMAWYNFDNLTISAWLNPTVTPSSWTGSIGIQLDGSYTSGRIFSISNYAGKFSVHTDTNSGWVTTQSETLPLNTWSHCVATLENGTNLKMYLNGQLVKTVTLNWGTNTSLTASNSRISIGVDLPGDDEKYTGSYSDIRIYATALTADDILTLYKTSGIIDNKKNIYAYEFKDTSNIIASDKYFAGHTNFNDTFTRSIVNDIDSPCGEAMKLTCTAQGTQTTRGYYFGATEPWTTAKTKMIHGHTYELSMFVKMNKETTNFRMNVECASSQSQTIFSIGTKYKRIVNTFVYNANSTYSAITNYGTIFDVGDEIFIHSPQIQEVDTQHKLHKNGVLSHSGLDESSQAKIYKYSTEANEFIEI